MNDISSAALIPAMPVIRPQELGSSPVFLAGGDGGAGWHGFGWQDRPASKGGPGFVLARRTAAGFIRPRGRYPLTGDGWAQAWQELVTLDPALAGRAAAALAARGSLACDDTGPAAPSPAAPASSIRTWRIVAGVVLAHVTVLCAGIAFVFGFAVTTACQNDFCVSAGISLWGHFEGAQVAFFSLAAAGLFFRSRGLLTAVVTIGIAGQVVALGAFLSSLGS